jgi:hypothetical protein
VLRIGNSIFIDYIMRTDSALSELIPWQTKEIDPSVNPLTTQINALARMVRSKPLSRPVAITQQVKTCRNGRTLPTAASVKDSRERKISGTWSFQCNECPQDQNGKGVNSSKKMDKLFEMSIHGAPLALTQVSTDTVRDELYRSLPGSKQD